MMTSNLKCSECGQQAFVTVNVAPHAAGGHGSFEARCPEHVPEYLRLSWPVDVAELRAHLRASNDERARLEKEVVALHEAARRADSIARSAFASDQTDISELRTEITALRSSLAKAREAVLDICRKYKFERQDAAKAMGARFQEERGPGREYYLQQVWFEDQRKLAAEEIERQIRALDTTETNNG